MSESTGRNDKWQRWNANRPPVENTPRREQQLRDREASREAEEVLEGWWA